MFTVLIIPRFLHKRNNLKQVNQVVFKTLKASYANYLPISPSMLKAALKEEELIGMKTTPWGEHRIEVLINGFWMQIVFNVPPAESWYAALGVTPHWQLLRSLECFLDKEKPESLITFPKTSFNTF